GQSPHVKPAEPTKKRELKDALIQYFLQDEFLIIGLVRNIMIRRNPVFPDIVQLFQGFRQIIAPCSRFGDDQFHFLDGGTEVSMGRAEQDAGWVISRPPPLRETEIIQKGME